MNLQRRLDALNQDKSDWITHSHNIVDTCNSTENNTIQMKPDEAVKPSNHLWVAWHLQNASKKNRKYEEIKKEIWLE